MATEDVLCFCRKHWIILFHYLIGIPIFWGFFIWYAYILNKQGIISVFGPVGYQTIAFILVIAGTYLHHRIFIRLLNYYLQTVIVTNYRIIDIDKTIFFRDSRDTLDVKEIQDMVMKKDGVFRTILDYGDIEIHLSSVAEPRCLRYLPNPEYHFRKIHKTKRAYIAGRQIAKENLFQVQQDRYPDRIIQESQVETMPPIPQDN